MKQEQSVPSHVDYVQAPNGARLQASTLDTVFSAALAKSATVMLASVMSSDYEFIAAILITVLYYALPLTFNGQTLGKKIFGLRVLPIGEDRSLNLKEALIRETVGKAMSFIALGIGFFMILWHDDRRALHDLLSKTIVVQDAAVAERYSGFFAGLAKSVVVSSFLLIASISYFYYSSFIADRLEAQLTSQGIKVGDVSGSFAKGFRFTGLEISNENEQIKFGTIDISFSDYAKIFSEQILTLNAVRFNNTEMTVKSGSGEGLFIGLLAMPFITPEMQTEEEPEQKPAQQPDEQGPSIEKRRLKKIIFNNIIAENTKVIDPAKTIEVSLFHFEKLVVDPKTKSIGWDSLKVRSSLVDLDTRQANLDKGEVKLDSPATAKLYQIPGVKLLKPIDLVTAFSFSKGKFENLQINAFENKVTLTSGAGKNYQLWVSSLAPSDYLANLPFDKISFYSSTVSPFELITGLPQSASFQIGSANFVYQRAAVFDSRLEAHHQASDAHYALKLPPGFLSTLVTGGGKIDLSSNQNIAPEEILYRLGAKNPLGLSKFFASPSRLPASP